MSNLKLLMYAFFLMVALKVSAADVTYEVSPQKIRENSNFTITFRIVSYSKEEPFIAFIPQGVEVVNKQVAVEHESHNQKGELVIKNIYKIDYLMFASRKGQKKIEKIIVDTGSGNKRVRPIIINVEGKPRKPPKMFVEAVISKKSVYLGEGLNIEYYFFFTNKVTILPRGIDTREFPKLNKFIKRYLKKPPVVDRVKYNGYLYNRTSLYASRIYPQQKGELKIDPIKISVDYKDRTLRFNRNKITAKYQSKTVKINVKEVPINNDHSSLFTLVGDHKVRIQVNKEKFLVNEPIEISLEVVGPGELENMSAPRLYFDNSLEEFEVKSDFSYVDDKNSKKRFEYTFLAGNNLSIPEREVEITYFEPKTRVFKKNKLIIPALNIRGGSKSSIATNLPRKVTIRQKKDKVMNLTLATPIFQKVVKDINLLSIIVWIFLISNLLIVLLLLRIQIIKLGQKDEVDLIIAKIKQEGVDYSSIYKMLMMVNSHDNKNLNELIDDLEFSEKASDYFKYLLNECAKKNYSKNIYNGAEFHSGYFAELRKLIKDEDSKEFKRN